MFEVLKNAGLNWYLLITLLVLSVSVIALITIAVIAAKGTGPVDILEMIRLSGFEYDPNQDMFYSDMNPWQRKMGYCRLYDEALAPLGMIIDCEPIYFEYSGRRWLIEFWKGQYDLNTGCEIGVYCAEGLEDSTLDLVPGTFYHSISDEDCLEMAFVLEKNGQTLFSHRAKHWWLTGFRPGEFSEPGELVMQMEISLQDQEMCRAFIQGLREAGYGTKELINCGNTVFLKFAEPHTPQPVTRTAKTDALIQEGNRRLCEEYQAVTGPYNNFPDKMRAIQEQAPHLFKEIVKIGKTEQVFEAKVG